MNVQKIYPTVDLLVIAVANLFNILMAVIFYLRTKNISHPMIFAYVWVSMVIMLVTAAILNIISKRSWWTTVLPLMLAVFFVVELILDYIIKFDFRSTGLLAPYLILYYVSILGMIGYSFLTEKKFGIITLTTYFLCQIAAFYSYSRVGHG